MMEKNGLPALSLPLLLIFARPFTYLRKKFQKLVLRAQISIYNMSNRQQISDIGQGHAPFRSKWLTNWLSLNVEAISIV